MQKPCRVSPFLIASLACVTFLSMCSESFSADAQLVSEGAQQQWVPTAERIVDELAGLLHDSATWEGPAFSTPDPQVPFRKTDQVLWRLWKKTGLPPAVRGPNEPLAKLIERNVSAYRQYVTEHADLSLEDLHRLGLRNAVDAFGSPLWYMTIRYLREEAGCETKGIGFIEIRTTPNRLMVTMPLDATAYRRLSGAVSRWLTENRDRFVWDPHEAKFTPKDGQYVGTEDLFSAIIETTSDPEGTEFLKKTK